MNGLRQYTAIYIITYAFVESYRNKSWFRFLLLILCAGSIHSSSYFILPLYFLRYINLSNKTIKWLYLLSAAFVAFGSLNNLFSLVEGILTAYYRIYFTSELNVNNSLSRIITKLMFLPIYLMSLSVLKSEKITTIDKALYKLGAVSYSLRLFFLGNFILTRVSQLFILLSILPLFIYLKDLYQNRERGLFFFFFFVFLLFYLSKTVMFPTQEYLYNSIYFE